jgi:hypothetical protein
MWQTLLLQTKRQSREQETHPNELSEITGGQILPTEIRTHGGRNIAKTVWTPRPLQMLVVGRRRQDGGPDTGASLPPLQPIERPVEDALERGGESNGM